MIDILVILDRSGSMEEARADHEGGLRSFVRDQADLDGDVRFTLAQFDSHDPCEIVFDRAPIRDVRETEIRLIPRGATPLLDAIGRATTHLMAAQAKDPSEVTIAMIITDGEENASTEWMLSAVKMRIAELERAGWRFLFLVANIDAFAEAGQLGIATLTVLPYQNSRVAVKAAYGATSANVLQARSMANAGSGWIGDNAGFSALTYTAAQRVATMQPTVMAVSDDSGSTSDK